MNDGNISIILDGHIYVEETDKDGNVIGREEIDGNSVLNIIVLALEISLNNFEQIKLEEKNNEQK